MTTLQWRWLTWQVFIPIFGPIVLSGVIILLWMSSRPYFMPNLSIIMDVSPWALTFYSLTLIGATLNELWPKFSNHRSLGVWLICVAFAVGLYASFIVVWRHDDSFTPTPAGVYFVTLLLLMAAVALCHMGYSANGGSQDVGRSA